MVKGKTQQLIVTDQIFFEVGNIDDAICFYQSIGFILNFRIPKLRGVSLYRGASFYVAQGMPRLTLKQTDHLEPSWLGVEVGNAKNFEDRCGWNDINGELWETETGFTFQVKDPWNNKIDFIDYTKKPQLARPKI